MVAARAMLRRAALLVVLLSSPALVPLACGTGVVGIDQCREIEETRCEASAACGTVDDVDACKRFYRDHCMHGIEGTKPSDDQQSDCVAAIKAAGVCAVDGKNGPETAPASCPGGAPTTLYAGKPLATTCDIVKRPWDTEACSFLSASDEPEETGEGGAAGSGGT